MHKIERFWNIVYYFIFKKYKGIFLFSGVTFKALFFNDIKTNRCMIIMYILSFFVGLSFCFILFGIFDVLLNGVFILCPAIISIGFNYYILLYKSKCVDYFKDFEAQPIRWKRKWSWISFGTIVIILLFLVTSFRFMDYSLHRSGLLPRHP